MIKRALITGTTGQDGAYLAKFLIKKRYEVYGTYRRLSTPNFCRLQYLKIFDQVQLIPCDLLDSDSLSEALKISDPDEIYNLAAQSFVGASFWVSNLDGLIALLDLARHISLKPEMDNLRAILRKIFAIPPNSLLSRANMLTNAFDIFIREHIIDW